MTVHTWEPEETNYDDPATARTGTTTLQNWLQSSVLVDASTKNDFVLSVQRNTNYDFWYWAKLKPHSKPSLQRCLEGEEGGGERRKEGPAPKLCVSRISYSSRTWTLPHAPVRISLAWPAHRQVENSSRVRRAWRTHSDAIAAVGGTIPRAWRSERAATAAQDRTSERRC